MTSADTFSAERLLAHRFPEIRHSYVERDTILYALGIGLGADPIDAVDLLLLPYGTALGVYALWVLLHEEAKRLFDTPPASDT